MHSAYNSHNSEADFVPYPWSRIPPPTLDELRLIFDDLDSDLRGWLKRELGFVTSCDSRLCYSPDDEYKVDAVISQASCYMETLIFIDTSDGIGIFCSLPLTFRTQADVAYCCSLGADGRLRGERHRHPRATGAC